MVVRYSGKTPTQNERVVGVPVDWYMAGDGLRARNDTRWIWLILHPDGSVTWEEPSRKSGGEESAIKRRFVKILTQWDDGDHLPANIERLADFLINAIDPVESGGE